MKKLINPNLTFLATLLVSFNMISYGQSTVLVPFSGQNSVASCTNVILQDHAGSSNYNDNANGFTVLNASGSSVINISGSYQTESGYDNIWIYAGSGTSGSVLATYTGTGNVNYTGVAGQTLTVRFGSDVSAQGTGFNFNVTYSGCSPTISLTQSLVAFSQCGATPSVSQSFSVSGANLTGTLQVGPLTDFEFSLDNTTFSSSLTLSPTTGTIANTNITIRLNRTTNGTSSGNVPLASSGATSQNIAVSGQRFTSVTPSITGLSNVTAGESITLSGSGTPNVNLPWTSSNTNTATVNSSGVVSGTGAGSVIITYMNSSGCTSTSTITVAAAPIPTISSFSPSSAEVGATVTITGTNFSTTANNNVVYFGSARATVTSATATQLTVLVPNGSTRDFISVTKGGLTAYSRRNFNLFNSGTASISGAFSLGSDVTVSSIATTTSALQNSYPGFDVIVGAADFDNDGWPDIFKAGNGAVNVNRNLLTGTSATIAANQFSAPSNFTVTGDVRTIVTADIDSDGKLDIITGSSTGISILKNTSTSGTISFAAAVNISTATTNVRVVDFDLDGKLDIAAVNDGNLNIFKNTTTSSITFNSAVATALSSTGFTGIDVGDLNNDGKIDIVATKNGSSTNVIVNNSTINSLTLSNSITINNGTYYPIVDDIDNDGIVDIYTWNKFFKNNYSTGTLSSSNFTEFSNSLVDEGGLGISAPDINADGYPEIILGSWWSHYWIYRNAGTGVSASIFSSRQTNSNGGHAIGVDLNGDQKIDLVSSNHGGNSGNANIRINQNTMTPTSVITVNHSITTFNKCVNSASAQQSFTVSGAGLQGNIVITPPAGFEISTTSGSGFGTTAITLTPTSATVNSTTIYVRVPAANNTSSSGTLSLTSSGASTVNISLASTMLADLVVTGSPSTSAQSYCVSGTATALTAAATGPSVTYQWQSATTSNGTYSNAVGGTGVTTNTYTPPTTTAGTLYYRCYFNSSCGNTAGAASGAITVSANNTVGTASSTPTLCVNTALTDITHATTGLTGIGTATGLPSGVTAAFASNTITISGTPTASGTFSYTVPTTGGCGSVNASGTITVNAASTVGAASSSPNVCPGTTITSITHSTSGATGIGTATGMPAGVTAAWASNTITISGAPTTAGTYNYSIPLSGGCGTVNATGTIVAKSSNLAAVTQPSSASQVYCLNATATPLTVLYTDANTYQWYAMDAANWSGQVAISGATTTSYTPPTNTIGTKYYRCSVVACSGANTSSTVTGAITTTDGSVWTGAVSTDPTNSGNWNTTCGSGNKVIVAGTTNSPVYSDLTIASGETFSLQEGAKVTVNGVLTNSGTLNINSGATLVQGGTSTYAGTGTVNVAQKITGGSASSVPNGRFWYLGTPVTGANATTFYSNAASNVVKERDEPNTTWNVVTNSASVALTPGKGYYVRASNGTANSATQTSLSLNFTGGGLNNNPTTSAITIPCTRTAGVASEGFNLVSNPYPSYLNWDNVTKTDVSNTMWYRTSTGSNWNSTMVFETYVSGAAGGIGTNLSGNTASKLIPPMQSFWVRVNSGSTTGSITLDNSMRSHFSSFGSSTAGLRSTNDDLKMFLRMNLLQEEDKDQIIVYVNNNSSNEFDAFDGEKMMQVDRPQFYTTSSEKKIVINGLSAINTQKSLPITMELTTTGNHQFMVEDLQVESGNVWLEDKTLGTFQLLNQGFGYKFFAYEGISDDRFVLHLKLKDEPTPNFEEANEIEANLANVYSEGSGVVVIKLPTTDDVATDVQIYDASGRVYFTGTMKTLESKIQLEQAKGIYYVSLTSVNGVEVRKVFIQ